jgi:Flp pilus assembly protein CpaB
MMRNKFILGLALFFGLSAAFLTYFYLHRVTIQAQNRSNTQVVVATQNIPINTTITNDMVELKPFPTDLRNNLELVDISEAVGKINNVAISKGEVLLNNHIVKPGESIDQLAYTVPQGMRAMTVPVDEVTGVANMIVRGNRVDIIGNVSSNDGTNERAVVILQNIEVLAVGTSISQSAKPDSGNAPKTITLAVDPQSALKLKMALLKGGISMVLRSPADKETTNTTPFTANEF